MPAARDPLPSLLTGLGGAPRGVVLDGCPHRQMVGTAAHPVLAALEDLVPGKQRAAGQDPRHPMRPLRPPLPAERPVPMGITGALPLPALLSVPNPCPEPVFGLPGRPATALHNWRCHRR